MNEYSIGKDKAILVREKEYNALIANQIKGRCKDCKYSNDGDYTEYCYETTRKISSDHYCSYFTARTKL